MPRPCAACGTPIEFLEGPGGRMIPVQRVRTVYLRVGHRLFRSDLDSGGYVSHFEVCSDPSRFSKGKRTPGD